MFINLQRYQVRNNNAIHTYFIFQARTENFTDCRYAVFDFKFTCSRHGAGTSKMDKICFMQICPDGAPIKKKMVYASSASAIKHALGTDKFLQFQVSDESELNHRELIAKLTEKYADN
ncbi:hypothetical protein WR25_10107 [Diploscapter pachys]|uniref:ADF-H domain-containing protein n=1 Tax=Diploscapter pachys TaxID=2018661 RepID=A0A2A2J5I4_9BILA|nr:hypothetical protein WR25_10107 [Diploscapter pachys]